MKKSVLLSLSLLLGSALAIANDVPAEKGGLADKIQNVESVKFLDGERFQISLFSQNNEEPAMNPSLLWVMVTDTSEGVSKIYNTQLQSQALLSASVKTVFSAVQIQVVLRQGNPEAAAKSRSKTYSLEIDKNLSGAMSVNLLKP